MVVSNLEPAGQGITFTDHLASHNKAYYILAVVFMS